MANELTGILSIRYSKGTDNFTPTIPALALTVTAKDRVNVVGTATTGDTSVGLGTIATDLGAVLIVNYDVTNSLLVGPDGTNYYLSVPPGMAQLFTPNAWAALHVKSSASTVDYMIAIWSI